MSFYLIFYQKRARIFQNPTFYWCVFVIHCDFHSEKWRFLLNESDYKRQHTFYGKTVRVPGINSISLKSCFLMFLHLTAILCLSLNGFVVFLAQMRLSEISMNLKWYFFLFLFELFQKLNGKICNQQLPFIELCAVDSNMKRTHLKIIQIQIQIFHLSRALFPISVNYLSVENIIIWT